MRAPSLAGKTLRLALMALAAVWSLAPIALIVLSSVKPPLEIFAIPPTLVFEPSFASYHRLLEVWPGFLPNMLNSVIVTAGATVITVAAAFLAGYVYSRCDNWALTTSAFFMILIRMMPPIIVTLPMFPVINWLGLNDTHLVLMLFYAAFFVSLATWILRAFIDQIPRELEEAAVIDGAGLRQILLRVVLPLVGNGLVAASIFVVVFAWNEYFFALIFTTREARTTPLIIAEILSTVEGVDWGILFAAATVQLVPILVFVIAVQRYVVAGLTASAVKG